MTKDVVLVKWFDTDAPISRPMDKLLLKRIFLDQAPTLGGLAFVVCCLTGLVAAGFSIESSLLLMILVGPFFVLALYALVMLFVGILALIKLLADVARHPARQKIHQPPSR